MIHVYSFTTLVLFCYIIQFRKEIMNIISRDHGKSLHAKTGIVFIALAVLSLFCVPLLYYAYPRLALCAILLTMAIYVGCVWSKYSIIEKIYTFFQTKEKRLYVMGLICTLVICGTFCTIISFKTLPIAEGWYSTYAKLINEGNMPYRDFELLFPPFYAYFIAFITKIFGYELYVLRIVGIVIFLILAALLYVIFNKVFHSNSLSCIIATVSALFLQSEVVQVFYDYIRVFDVLTYVSTLCLILYLQQYISGKKTYSLWITVAGIASALAFLVRQNSGAFVIAYTIALFVGLICVMPQKKRLVCNFINYIIATLIPILTCGIIMYANGILDLFLNKTTTSAINAKGGVWTILFAWIPRVFGQCNDFISTIVFLFLIIGVNYLLYCKFGQDASSEKKNTFLMLVFSGATFVGLLACYLLKAGSNSFGALSRVENYPFIAFFVVLFIFVYELVIVINNRKLTEQELRFHLPYFALAGMIVAINYGCATSASLSNGQTALDVGFVLGTILYLCRHKYAGPMRMGVLAFCVCMCLSIVSVKYQHPYEWWGLTETDIRDAKYELEIPNAKNIYVSKSTKKGIEGIYQDIVKYSDEDDSIFVFPHAPIFYTLANRTSDTYTYVQWFDVSSDKGVVEDIEVLQENPPKVIVHIHVPKGVIDSHESLFRTGEHSGLYKMDRALKKLEEKENYKIANKYKIQKYEVTVYYLEN